MRTNLWRVTAVVAVVGALLLAAGMLAALNHLDEMPVHVMINGVGMPELLDLHAPSTAHQLTLVVGLAAVLVFGLLLLPMLLLLLVLCLALPLGLLIGIPLLVLLALFAVVLGPLLLLAWGLWRLLRAPAAAPAPVTIPS